LNVDCIHNNRIASDLYTLIYSVYRVCIL